MTDVLSVELDFSIRVNNFGLMPFLSMTDSDR